MPAPGAVTTVISDFGGVLTSPLIQSFASVQDETGIPMEELGKAMSRIESEDGAILSSSWRPAASPRSTS